MQPNERASMSVLRLLFNPQYHREKLAKTPTPSLIRMSSLMCYRSPEVKKF